MSQETKSTFEMIAAIAAAVAACLSGVGLYYANGALDEAIAANEAAVVANQAAVEANKLTLITNRATHRAQTIKDVIATVEDFKRDALFAPHLLLTLKRAADDAKDGVLEDPDIDLLANLLMQERMLKGNAHLCREWSRFSKEFKPDANLDSLVRSALNPEECR